MSEKIKSEAISRRGVLSFLRLPAFSLAVPATVLTASDACPAPANRRTDR